jgi:hypothetical protein
MKHYTMKTWGNGGIAPPFLTSRWKWVVMDRTRWAPEPIWTLWSTEGSLALTGNPILALQPLPVSIPTELSRLQDLSRMFHFILFEVCLTTLSQTQNILRQMMGWQWIMNWKDQKGNGCCLILVLSQLLFGGTEEYHRTCSKISRGPCRSSAVRRWLPTAVKYYTVYSCKWVCVWRWRLYVPTICCYPRIRLHGVIDQNTTVYRSSSVVSNHKMKAVNSSELSVIFYQTTRRHISEGSYLLDVNSVLDAVTPCRRGRCFRRFGGAFFFHFQGWNI